MRIRLSYARTGKSLKVSMEFKAFAFDVPTNVLANARRCVRRDAHG